MRKCLIFVLLLCMPAFASRVSVRPHVTKRGKVIQWHQRTSPNGTQRDNWSSKPNVNPNTGKAGKKTPKR